MTSLSVRFVSTAALCFLAISCSSSDADPNSSSSGGTPSSGGSGTISVGGSGAGGTGSSSGGNNSAGMSTGTSGSGTTGGMSGGGTGACGRALGACTAPAVSIKSVNVGVPVTAYGSQSDTAPLPMAISSIPSGGSRLAWLGTDEKVYIAELDCDDELVGTPFSLPAEDLQDLYADDTGGVVMVVRNATNTGTDNCGGGELCGGTSAQCQGTWLVRFDTAGKVVWETQVTNLTDTVAGYDDGAIFSWKHYQHHGRIGFDGASYAAYFAAAITVYNTGSSGCVDIHEGDRMQVVDGSGKLLTGHNSFPWALPGRQRRLPGRGGRRHVDQDRARDTLPVAAGHSRLLVSEYVSLFSNIA